MKYFVMMYVAVYWVSEVFCNDICSVYWVYEVLCNDVYSSLLGI